MSLNDPFFTKFDGGPDVGRVPTRLIVLGGGELSGAQLRGVEHVYGQFRNACKLSAANFHTEQVKLQDGTIVHMWSLQGRDEVTVTPAPSDEGCQLPHGFVVATNWQTPLFYCRDLNDGIHWVIAGDPVPQIDALANGIYDNQVFRKAGDAYFNLPHVYDSVLHSIWDYGPDGGLTGGPSGSKTPFRIKNTTTGELTFEPAHYAAQNLILDADGTTLYTVTDEAPILSPSAEGYPDPITYFPGATDAAGNQLAMNAWRYAVLSPSSNIWKFRLWNERINRTGDDTYAVVERAVTEFTTPWGHQTVTTTSINDNSLGEDPALLFKYKGTFDRVADASNGVFGLTGRPTHVFNTGWAGVSGYADISGVNLRGNDNQSLRQIKEQTAGISTLDKLVATAGATDAGYIPIERRLNYPASIFWRGGAHQKWYYPEDLIALWGLPVGTPLNYNNYRVHDVAITRFDTKYDVDGAPTITAKLGWMDLHLVEGTTTGRMSGKEYINQLGQSGVYPFIDGEWANRYIMKSTLRPSDFWPLEGFYDHLYNNNSNDEYWADYLAHGTQGYLGGPAPQPAIKYEYPFNIRPSNTVSYDLKSRYVIDFDQKGRFYAAIRCEVVCSGAAWKEDIAVYKGFMIKDTDPSYTVKIYFESNWAGVEASLLLVEETCTRPIFESPTIYQFSPWYWPFPEYVDRDCRVQVPPEPVPDENFMMMFKNLASHQGVNTNLCCADVRPDITGADVALTQSTEGIEYSYLDGGSVIPHEKYVTGQLYARTFKLSDFNEAFWMLRQLKVNATEDNIAEDGGPGGTPRPPWFYHPAIKAALDVQRHIEVRDGVIVQWSDNIQGETSGYPPTPADPPPATDREINLYRV